MVIFKEYMSTITLPINSLINFYEINRLCVKKYIFNNFTRSEKEFNSEFIIHLFNKREWFPKYIRDLNIQQQNTIEKQVSLLYKCLALEWCDLWKNIVLKEKNDKNY